MRFRLGKKGLTFGSITAIVMTLVFLGLTLGMGVYVSEELGDVAYSGEAVPILCEAVTWPANSSWMAVSKPYIKSVDYMYNSSTCIDSTAPNTLIGSGNYTVSDDKIYLNATGIEWFGSGIKYVNYTAYNQTGYLAIKNATSGMGRLAQWMPIISVVLAAGIVIGTLILSFGKRGGI